MVVREVLKDKNKGGNVGRKGEESHDWSIISKQMAEIFESV